MNPEYPRSRLWIEWCMQLFKKQRYLARDFKALRCQIRYNPESIRGVVVQMMSRAIPTAIRTCSTPTGTMMVVGSTPTTTGLTTSGTTMAVSRSLFRNSLYFSSAYFAEEFCFVSWPFQPPSILPASSNFMESAMYFLSSRDFVSHSTNRSTRSVSSFLIARRT